MFNSILNLRHLQTHMILCLMRPASLRSNCNIMYGTPANALHSKMKWVSLIPDSAMPKSKMPACSMGTTEMLSPSPDELRLECCRGLMPNCLKAEMPSKTPLLPLSFDAFRLPDSFLSTRKLP